MTINLTIFKITEDDNLCYGIKRIKPVWGKNIDIAKYYELNVARQSVGLSIISPSEVGCAFAHISALEHCIENNIDIVVIEDDIPISQVQIQRLLGLVKHLEYSFIHLCKIPNNDLYGKKIAGETWELNMNFPVWGAAAYAITPQFAKYVLSCQKKILRRADEWHIFHSEISSSELNGFYYFPIFHHLSNTSHIENERKVRTYVPLRIHIKNRLNSFVIKFKMLVSLSRKIQ